MVQAGEYGFGSDSGRMLVRTYRTGLGSRAGHDLVIEVSAWRGRLTIAPGETQASGELTADVDSFTVVEGRGGVKPLTDSDRADIRSTIRQKILDAARHPTIEFRSDSVSGPADDATVRGQLTIRGTTRPISLTAALQDGEGGTRLRARAEVTQSDWGVKPYSAFLGALKLRDSVEIEVDAALVPAG